MLKKIEALRKKPKHVRNRFAMAGSLLTTAIVAVIWLTSLPSQFSDAPEVLFEDDDSGGFSRAFDDVKGQFANVLGGVKESLEEIELQTEEATSESETVKSDDQAIDFSAMFEIKESKVSTTTSPTSTESESKPEKVDDIKRHVLIGTSSVSDKSN